MKIGLVAALIDEAKNLYSKLGELIEVKTCGGYTVRHYTSGSHNLYLVISGVGEINAALATQYLILSYDVDCIVNFGVVGSLSSSLKAGDVVLADEVVHYDFTVSANQTEKYGYYIGAEDFYFKVDGSFMSKLPLLASISKVRIASADKFVNDSRLKEWIVNSFDCKICDMESAGIFFAAKTANVPLLLIKSVSDNADESADCDFQSIVENGVDFYIDLINQLIASI